MPAYDFVECMIYESMEPFGDRGRYFQSGMITAMIANVNRRQGSPAFSPIDFMPDINKPEKVPPQTAQTSEELHAMFSKFSEARAKHKDKRG